MARDQHSTPCTDYDHFCRTVLRVMGVCLLDYKTEQMRRRLDSFRMRLGAEDYYSLSEMLEKDPEKVVALADFMTINVTEFFRNKEMWDVLRETVIPELARHHRRIRVWSAGTSSGQEAYSLAMTFEEVYPGRAIVLATDIDNASLQKARKAVYTGSEVSGVPPWFLSKYFTAEVKDTYRVKDRVARCVDFRKHDLLRDSYPVGLHLIVCRNVLIYFADETRKKVISNLSASLKPGGYLFVGVTEVVMSPGEFGLSQFKPFFYRKNGKDV